MNSSRKHDSNRRSAGSGNRWARWLTLAAPLLAALAALAYVNRSESPPPLLGYEVVETYPHDPNAYTQGLVYEGGKLFESTGGHGSSELRRVNPATGSIEESVSLSEDLFGEGIAIVGDEIFQVTWKNGIAIVYDKHTLQEKRRHAYSGEGWGLAYDGQHLILSDGTSQLRFIDPATFQVARTANVTSGGQPVERINELEMINGLLYANVWYSDRIARIDPQSGNVLGWIDLVALEPQRSQPDAVLNGIAYDPNGKRLFVTGKLWPRLYEIRIRE